MSLLRAIRIARLHNPPKFTLIASMSSLPGSTQSWVHPLKPSATTTTTPAPESTPEADSAGAVTEGEMKFFDEFKKSLDSSITVDDAGPPAAPATAYGAPNPPNPVADTRNASNVLERSRPTYGLYVKATRNNTITTFTRPEGGTIALFSGGKVGFKGQKRATYEAGYQCAVRMFEAIQKRAEVDRIQISLRLNGFGQGRDAVYRALMATEGEEVRPLVTRVTDITPIKVGGTRAKKVRRT